LRDSPSDANPGVRSAAPAIVLLTLFLLALLLVSVFIGRYPSPYWMPPTLLQEDEIARQLIVALRLPRLVAAVLLGATLAAAGLTMQMIFRNPLVEPGFLGVSQGAAFGAALGIVLMGGRPSVVQALASIFALLGLALTWLLARTFRFGGATLRLILAGIVVSALFASAVGLLKLIADPLRQLPELTFWLLGGLFAVSWKQLLLILPVVVPALVGIHLLRWRLNVLSLSDETAFALGVAVRWERLLLLVLAVLATAAVVSIAGMVGWIGLITPHLARRLQGTDARRALPVAMLLGAILCVACDDAARSLIGAEIPLGILTSMVGAITFASVMIRPQQGLRS
jgi:iron complex transport system permease protein